MSFVEILEISLPIMLYFVGIVATVLIIIILVKFLKLLKKIRMVVDDVDKKVKSLDGAFKIVDRVTDKISFLMDRITEMMSEFIIGLFSKKSKKGDDGDEERE